jgi:hypothetical protein
VADVEDAQWRQARREAAATLRGALGWTLPSQHWEQVRDVLAGMAAAASAVEPAALYDATETLSFYMPVRVGTRLGEDPAVPVPGFVREQIAELVDTLEAAGRGGAGLPGGTGFPGGTGLPGGRGFPGGTEQAARRGA